MKKKKISFPPHSIIENKHQYHLCAPFVHDYRGYDDRLRRKKICISDELRSRGVCDRAYLSRRLRGDDRARGHESASTNGLYDDDDGPFLQT